MVTTTDSQMGQMVAAMYGKIDTFEQLEQAINSWRDDDTLGLLPNIEKKWNPGLTKLFGPESEQVPVKSLSLQDIRRKLDIVKNYTNKEKHVHKGELILRDLDVDVISHENYLNYVLDAFYDMVDPETGQNIFYGIKLDSHDIKKQFAGGLKVHQSLIAYNTSKVQRPLTLLSIAEKALGNYCSNNLHGQKSRLDKEARRVNSGDGQHGGILASMHQLLYLPISVSTVDGVREDANILITANGDALPLSEFQDYVARVTRSTEDAAFLGRDKIMKSDQWAFNLAEILKKAGVKLIDEARKSDARAGQCSSPKQIFGLFEQYPKSKSLKSFTYNQLFAALKLQRSGWPSQPVTADLVWGGCSLFKRMEAEGITSKVYLSSEWIDTVASYLSKEYTSAENCWGAIKKKNQEQHPIGNVKEGFTKWHNHPQTSESFYGDIIACGIIDIVRNTEAFELETSPGDKHKGKKPLELPSKIVVTVKGAEYELDVTIPIKSFGNKAYVRPAKRIEQDNIQEKVVNSNLLDLVS
jgi:hypothetical protein